MKKFALFTALLGISLTLSAQLPKLLPTVDQAVDFARNCLTYNQKAAHKTSRAQTDLPTTCIVFVWNQGTSTWDSTLHVTQSYKFAAGEARVDTTTIAIYAGNAWTPAERYIEDYDTWGNLSYNETQLWNANAFENYRRTYRYFDAYGTSLGRLRLEFINSAWDTISHTRGLATYNVQNQPTEVIIEERDLQNQTWLPTDRTLRFFNANSEEDSLVFFTYQNNAWVPLHQYRDYQWYDFSERQYSSFFDDSWNATAAAFDPSRFESVSYTDSNGSNVRHVLTYNSGTASYDSSQKIVHVNFGQGLNSSLEIYAWNNPTGSFVLTYGERITYTLTGTGAVEEAVKQLWSATDGWVNHERYVCTDFIVGSAPRMEPTNAFAQWASHPIGQQGELLVKSERPGRLFLKISQLNGTVVAKMERRHSAGQQFHSFELGLPAGIYVYELSLNGAVQKGKVQVR